MVMAQGSPKTVLVPVILQKESSFKRIFGNQSKDGAPNGVPASLSGEGSSGEIGLPGAGSPRSGASGALSGPVGDLVLARRSLEMVRLALDKLVMTWDTLVILLVQPPPDNLGPEALRSCETELGAHLCNLLRTDIDLAEAQSKRVVVEVRLRRNRVETVLCCAEEHRAGVVVYRISVRAQLGVHSQCLETETSPEALSAALPSNTKVMVAYLEKFVKSLTGERAPLSEEESMVTSDHHPPEPARPPGPAAVSMPVQILRWVYGETEFRLEEIMQATQGFSHRIGQGGCGEVYRGVLGGRDVAVKRLKWWGATAGMSPSVLRGDQTLRQFMMELRVMRCTNHRHLLQLRGVCVCDKELLLIFDLLTQGSLDHRLRGEPVLTWDERLQIAVGAAEGLRYLHHQRTPPIIHRDVKTANILLDNNLMPQVADFGLAKIAPETRGSQAFTVSAIMGTQGYVDPEYLHTRRVNWAVDVYAFGVVLLELISGHVAFHPHRTPCNLSEYAFMVAMEEDYTRLLDRRLQGVPQDQLKNVLMLAVLCLSPNSNDRPRMDAVVHLLTTIRDREQLGKAGETSG